jgi:hypothetical protein
LWRPRRNRDFDELIVLYTVPVPAIAVLLEHPVVVSILAVHACIESLCILSGGLRLQ